MLTPASRASSVFAALGDPTRLRLVATLADGEPKSIAALSKGLAMSRQGVTKHLQVLQDAGLVQSRTTGRERQFDIAPDPIDDARRYLDGVAAQWRAALGRLQRYLDDDAASGT